MERGGEVFNGDVVIGLDDLPGRDGVAGMSNSLTSMSTDVEGTGVHDVTLSSNYDDPAVAPIIIGPSGVRASGTVFPGVDVGVRVDFGEDDDDAGRGGPNTDSVSSNAVAASDVEGGSVDH